jgi:fermentation-respiration switch protein FrsA (DUF1100 family)
LAVAILVLSLYGSLVAAMYFNQRQLEYIPVSPLPGTPKQNGVGEMSVVTVTTVDNLSLTGWFAPPKKPGGRVVVLFHGAGVHIGYNAFKERQLLDDGYGVFACEYRGFAGNPGTPTQDGLYMDGRAVMQWLKKQGYNESKIVLYGESLGTGVAVQMATEYAVSALVLEAPYSSTLEVAEYLYPFVPVRYLMKDDLNSLSKIGQAKAPLLIIHGTRDSMIPIGFSRKLFDAAKEPKTFIPIEGAEHPPDLYDHGAGKLILNWLDKQVGAK